MKNAALVVFLLLAGTSLTAGPRENVTSADGACRADERRRIERTPSAAAPRHEPRTPQNRGTAVTTAEEEDGGSCIACYWDYYFGPVSPRLIVGGDAKFAMCKAKYCP